MILLWVVSKIVGMYTVFPDSIITALLNSRPFDIHPSFNGWQDIPNTKKHGKKDFLNNFVPSLLLVCQQTCAKK